MAIRVRGGAARRAFKGNLDPVADMFQAAPEHCRRRAVECLRAARGAPYLLSAGCGVPGDTPDEVFRAFCGAPGIVS